MFQGEHGLRGPVGPKGEPGIDGLKGEPVSIFFSSNFPCYFRSI